MSQKTNTFGFATKSLETLNESLKQCNEGKLPTPGEIQTIEIMRDGEILSVHVVLKRI